MDLDAHGGKHRLFLIFAPSREDAGFVRQDRSLEGSEGGFVERELLRGDVLEDGTGSFDGIPVSSGDASVARERFGVEPGAFAALLVGKDGTVKRSSAGPVGPGEIFALVDEMPMRRGEMRERGGG